MGATSPALEVRRTSGQGFCHLQLRGKLDERFEGALLGELAPVTTIDLAGIRAITSFGVRTWRDFIQSAPATSRIFLLGCSPPFIDQVNMISNFCGHAEILTAQATCYCVPCKLERTITIDIERENALLRSGKTPTATCPACGEALEWEDPENYFRFVARCGVQRLDPEVKNTLKRYGVYSGRSASRPPVEVAKLIEGEVTIFRLEGVLDGRFRSRRLTAGVEGVALLGLAGFSIERDGIEGWNDFVLQLLKQCSSVILVDVPPLLIEMNERGEINFGGTIVYSVMLPCFCACDEIGSYSIPLGAVVNNQPLPVLCQRRGHPLALVEGLVALDHLKQRHRPTPPGVDEVIRRTNELFSTAKVEARLSASRSDGGDSSVVHIAGYRIVRPLSTGGMARIFLATRESLGGFEKPMALKLYRRSLLSAAPATVSMFLKEARVSANLNHPNIIHTFDVGEQSGDLYIAMEYIDGCDARMLLKRFAKPLPPAIIAYLGQQVAAALGYAHEALDLEGRPLRLIHRDVSLQNILIGYDGRVKLIDFGVALAAKEAAVKRSTVDGNVGYMSPEQARGSPLDGRSDLFSLGVVLYELAAGAHLFRRSDMRQTMAAVLTAPIAPLHRTPPGLSAVILRALERDPEQRFQTARQMAIALEQAASELDGVVTAAELSVFMKEVAPKELTPAGTPQPEAQQSPDLQMVTQPPHAFDVQETVAPPGRKKRAGLFPSLRNGIAGALRAGQHNWQIMAAVAVALLAVAACWFVVRC